MTKKETVSYSLIPEEKQRHEVRSDYERTLEMRLAYMKGAMHGVLADMNNYYTWMKERRQFRKGSYMWRWKTIFFRQFMSHFERRIQELAFQLERINYKG